jgi:hypothetical protein
MGITTTACLVFHYFSVSPIPTEETCQTGVALTASCRLFDWIEVGGVNLLRRDRKGSIFQIF